LPPAAVDLPDELDPLDEAPADLRGLELTGRLLRAHDLRIVESRLEDVDASETELPGATWRDVGVTRGSWAGANASSSRLERVAFEGVRLTGITLSSGSLTDAAFVDCRIDLAGFRFTELRNVHFDSCRLDEADFYEAKLASVLFTGCDLTRAGLAGAAFTRSELRGCRLDAIGNPEQLRGVRMPMADVVQAADVLAAAVGIEIVD
jgi:uncharacterized protein YjbI with pentapeptide repeats